MRQDLAIAATDVLSLLGMVASIVFYSLSIWHTPDRPAVDAAPIHRDVYDNIEGAEIRVFLPVKTMNSSSLENDITDPLGSIQVIFAADAESSF